MKHFQVFELVDRITFERMGDNAFSLFKPDALIALDDLREWAGAPITINNWYSHLDIPESEWEARNIFQWRGFRTPEKAIALGAPNSRHAKGDAFDLDVLGITAEEVRQRIIADLNNPLLAKITRLEAGKSWVHFDLMPLGKGVQRIYLFHV